MLEPTHHLHVCLFSSVPHPFQPRMEEMEASEGSMVLPVFPLGGPFMPYSKQKLNIFEPRPFADTWSGLALPPASWSERPGVGQGPKAAECDMAPEQSSRNPQGDQQSRHWVGVFEGISLHSRKDNPCQWYFMALFEYNKSGILSHGTTHTASMAGIQNLQYLFGLGRTSVFRSASSLSLAKATGPSTTISSSPGPAALSSPLLILSRRLRCDLRRWGSSFTWTTCKKSRSLDQHSTFWAARGICIWRHPCKHDALQAKSACLFALPVISRKASNNPKGSQFCPWPNPRK